jgi:hypothetical protein
MYTIGRVSEGIILICRDCGHIEHVSQIDVHIGSQRTQAAQAMQAHARDKHNAGRTHTPPEKLRSDGAVVPDQN